MLLTKLAERVEGRVRSALARCGLVLVHDLNADTARLDTASQEWRAGVCAERESDWMSVQLPVARVFGCRVRVGATEVLFAPDGTLWLRKGGESRPALDIALAFLGGDTGSEPCEARLIYTGDSVLPAPSFASGAVTP